MIDKIKSIFAPQSTRSNSITQVLERTLLGGRTAAGTVVTEGTALQSSAVFACVRILAESVGSLPLIMYERGPAGKNRAVNNALYRVLHDSPNPEMTSIEFRAVLQGHLALWGNAYAEIERNARGQIVALWPLRPDRIEIKRDRAGAIFYRYQLDGQWLDLPAFRVLHLKGLGYDGTRGYSPIALARQSIGLSLAMEEFGTRFFGNGAAPGGVLQHPGILGDEAHKRLQASWDARHEGLSNAFRLAILEEGMTYNQIGMPLQDAQFLESRKFQISEIARWYRIPPHMIGDLERATFSNIEQQSIEFVQHTLRPWLERWEQSLELNLLTPGDRGRYFIEHLVDGLLRGDTKTRFESYAIGRQWGWLSINDIRDLENMNPIENGDDYLSPLNMTTAGDQPEPGAEPAQAQGRAHTRAIEQRNVEDRVRLTGAFARVLLDLATRVIRRETNDIGRAVGKHLVNGAGADAFRAWLADFYADHREFWARQLLPILLSFADQLGVAVGRELDQPAQGSGAIEQFIENYIETFAIRQTEGPRMLIESWLDQAIEEGADPAEVIDERLTAWRESRPEQIAADESNQAGNAFVKQFFMLGGVTLLRWVNRGSENCPYCRALNGRVVAIQQYFLTSDSDFQPDGADRPLSKRGNIGHPPLHKGCNCVIVAEQ